MTLSGHRSGSLECDEGHNYRSKICDICLQNARVKPCGAEIYQAAQQHRSCMDADCASAVFGEVFGFLCGGMLEYDPM
jgi:hypothetical protein